MTEKQEFITFLKKSHACGRARAWVGKFQTPQDAWEHISTHVQIGWATWLLATCGVFKSRGRILHYHGFNRESCALRDDPEYLIYSTAKELLKVMPRIPWKPAKQKAAKGKK